MTDCPSGAYPANGEFRMRKRQVQPVKADKSYLTELGERRDKEGEREGATLREGRPGSARRQIVSSLYCGSPSHPAEWLRQKSNNKCEMNTHKRSAVFALIVSDCEIQILSFLCLHGSGDEHQRGKRDGSLGAHSPPFPLGFLPRTPFFLTPFPPVPLGAP